MKRTATANINANLYDGDFQLGYDCVGVTSCRFATCYLMPPDGSEDCFFKEYGSCRSLPAQQAALVALGNRIKIALKKCSDSES
jgi:hypothetical protein